MIDIELQNKLRAEYNPDGSLLRRQQMRMLEILLHIDKICKENNIPYWLSSGTLLGAVRHEGFIPWDDDVDIEMMREDYLRFEKIFKETDDYVLQTHKNDPFYMMPYAKVRDKHTSMVELGGSGSEYKYRGVFVDIFVIEHTHEIMNFATYAPIWLLSKWTCGKVLNGFARWVFMFCKKIIFATISLLRVILKLVPGKKLRHTYGTWCYNEGERYNEELFPLNIMEFEGYELPIPHNANAYLERLYGDYMRLPEVKEIHTAKVEFF